MSNYTNLKLYGYELINNDKTHSYFDLTNQQDIIDTWKVLVFNKNNNVLNDYSNKFDKSKIPRYENILWRIWHMNKYFKTKIVFKSSIGTSSNKLFGPILVYDSVAFS